MLGANGNYLTIPEVARAARRPVETIRRRLTRLSKKFTGLLISLEPPGCAVRKYWVNVQVLEKIDRLGEDHDPRADVAALEAKLTELEHQVKAHRTAQRKLKKELAGLTK